MTQRQQIFTFGPSQVWVQFFRALSSYSPLPIYRVERCDAAMVRLRHATTDVTRLLPVSSLEIADISLVSFGGLKTKGRQKSEVRVHSSGQEVQQGVKYFRIMLILQCLRRRMARGSWGRWVWAGACLTMAAMKFA